MSSGPPPQARSAPAASRNRAPILQALAPQLPERGLCLEIASGTGEHALAFAEAFPHLTWRPTDQDDDALESIAAWRESSGLLNLLAPLKLDAAAPRSWPVKAADVIVCINMVHISPWRATEGLFAGAAAILSADGLVFLYGPYLEHAVATAPSNLEFDASLKARDPSWGLRQLEAVDALAHAHGFARMMRIEMPANNLSVVCRRA